jgi:hypothetical protein
VTSIQQSAYGANELTEDDTRGQRQAARRNRSPIRAVQPGRDRVEDGDLVLAPTWPTRGSALNLDA